MPYWGLVISGSEEGELSLSQVMKKWEDSISPSIFPFLEKYDNFMLTDAKIDHVIFLFIDSFQKKKMERKRYI